MFLEENISRLNKQFNKYGIRFILDEDIIKVVEEPKFILQTNSTLKETLQKKVKVIFSKTNLWHINKDGIRYLTEKLLKWIPTREMDEMKRDLIEIIKEITDQDLQIEILQLLTNNKIFYEAPAAKSHHHNYRGGLLEHTLQTVKLALGMVESLGEDIIVDRDLIIAGSVLHDIGKINCYEFDTGGISITDIGRKQDHIVNGIKIVSQNIQSPKLDALLHIIASHHNLQEWGSPVPPQGIEAWIIHFAENCSSKVGG